MSWGISSNAANKEKLKAEMADYLNGFNSTGIMSYEVYSEALSVSMKLLDKMYDLGKFEK